MKIRIVYGFRGRETNEEYWPPDSVQEVDETLARQLIENGHAKRAISAVDFVDGDRDTQDAPAAQDEMDSASDTPRITTKRK